MQLFEVATGKLSRRGESLDKEAILGDGIPVQLNARQGLEVRGLSRSVPGITRSRMLAWLAIAIVAPSWLYANDLPPLTLDRLFAEPSLVGVVPSRPIWSADSRHFAFTWNDKGLPRRGLWVASQDGSNLRRLD